MFSFLPDGAVVLGGVAMIELREINKDNYSECINLKVSDEQKGFVASNVFSLAQAWVFYDNAHPLAIYADNVMVGFILFGPEESDNGMYMNIDRMMIDRQYQGRGYGKLAFAKLIDIIRNDFPYKEIYLSYNPENVVAENLYKRFGFAKTGEFSGDECIAVLKL